MSVSKNSLGQMLEMLREVDDDLAPEDFDPCALVGDIREKVDALKWRIDKWRYTAKMISAEYIIPLSKKAASLKGKADKLEDYILSEMIRQGVEKIPGNMFRLQQQSSTPSLEIRVPADASMYLNYPELVRQEVVYSWDKSTIKAHIDNGESFTFAELKQGKHIRFYAQGGEK